MSLIARFRRDITKHRGRSAVLGVLFVTMVVMSIRAVLELRPQNAAAFVPVATIANDQPRPVINSAETEARIKESKRLWQALRDVKPGAATAAVAFAFDASYYPPPPPDLTKHSVAAVPSDPEPVAKPTPASIAIEQQAFKVQRVREQARALVVKTTAVGNGTTPPMAIVNQQLLVVGQEILGFELTAIRPREVDFVKEGVTVVVKMPDGQ